jgi:hypothetical protein
LLGAKRPSTADGWLATGGGDCKLIIIMPVPPPPLCSQRDDFDPEWDNDAECTIAEMEFTEQVWVVDMWIPYTCALCLCE